MSSYLISQSGGSSAMQRNHADSSQELLVMSTSSIRIKKMCYLCNFYCAIKVSTKWAGLFFVEMSDHLEFSHTIVSNVFTEW